MALSENKVIAKMKGQVDAWEQAADARAIFLRCYMMMTQNMLSAIEKREFHDPAWVEKLLNRFADYYFVALESFESDPGNAPPIWRLAYDFTFDPKSLALQKLLVGVNAHINYDLVLTLFDLLEQEWWDLTEDLRVRRYQDHCLVNEVIGRTIDTVQDQILERAQPSMDIIDKLFGPLDELLISRLISRWRENVWEAAIQLLSTSDPAERNEMIHAIEDRALAKANMIGLNLGASFRELW